VSDPSSLVAASCKDCFGPFVLLDEFDFRKLFHRGKDSTEAILAAIKQFPKDEVIQKYVMDFSDAVAAKRVTKQDDKVVVIPSPDRKRLGPRNTWYWNLLETCRSWRRHVSS
jgi:hypothetical protein